MRISDWSSDVCSADLILLHNVREVAIGLCDSVWIRFDSINCYAEVSLNATYLIMVGLIRLVDTASLIDGYVVPVIVWIKYFRSEEHTSELQSLMRISYAVFCLKKNNITLQVIWHYVH